MLSALAFIAEVFGIAAVALAYPVRVTRQEERRIRERDR